MSHSALVEPIRRTKLHRPPRPPYFLDRPRTSALLTAGEEYPLTLVSAPAGFGKSSAVSAWIEENRSISAWVSLDERDNDALVFAQDVCEAVRQSLPEACEKTMDLLRVIATPTPSLATVFANDLFALEAPLTLVLDDFHCVQSTEALGLIRSLLDHPFGALRIVLVCRKDPALPLTLLRGRDLVRDIRVKDLRFTRAETAAYLRERFVTPVSDAELVLIDRSIEGWPVGLQLLYVATSSSPAPSHRLADSICNLPALHDYLMDEVLNGQPDERREMLLRASILPRFDIRLCSAVLCPDEPDDERAERFVNDLQRGALFAIALDSSGQWWRFHHVFQDLLRTRLDIEVSPDEVRALHRRAAEWFGARGMLEEAVDHALAAEDGPLGIELVHSRRYELMNREEWGRLLRLITDLPPSLVDSDSRMLTLAAWARQYALQLPESRRLRERAQAMRRAALETTSESIDAELVTLEAMECFMEANAEGARAAAETALAGLPDDACGLRGYAATLVTWALQSLGETKAARAFLKQELSSHRHLGPAYHTRVLFGHALTSYQLGDFEPAVSAAAQTLALGESHALPESEVFGHSILGWVHYHRNQFAEAEIHLQAVVQSRQIARRMWFSNCAYALARISLARADPQGARRTLTIVMDHALEHGLEDVLAEARSFAAELDLHSGALAAATSWAGEHTLDAGPRSPLFHQPDLTYAKVRIAEGTAESLAEADEVLSALEARHQKAHDPRQLADVLAVRLVYFRRRSRGDLASEVVARWLAIAARGNGCRGLVDAGVDVESELEHFERAGISAALRDRLIEANAAHLEDSGDLEAALTNREMDVLEYLSQRLQTKEIAARLFVSPETVKTHLSKIYRKLRVSGRRQAVVRARDLGILRES